MPRVVAADAAGAEALVGVLKIIKDASYNKTREPPWRAMEMRHPLWWLAPPPSPPLKRGHYGRSALCHMTLWRNVERFILSPDGESPAKPDKGETPKVANSAEYLACLRSRRGVPSRLVSP